LPWAAVRCGDRGDGDHPALLAALTCSRPWQLVVAKCLGLGAALAALAISGLPLALLAQQVSAASGRHVALALLSAWALCVFVAAVATGAALSRAGRLARWAITTSATVGVAAMLPRGAAPAVALVVAAMTGSIGLMLRANGRWRYLDEDHDGR
jgi:hypothetical protein